VEKTALLTEVNGVNGRWVETGNQHVFVDGSNKVVFPQDLKGENLEDLDLNVLPSRPTNSQKLQLVSALFVQNSASYPLLNKYLEGLKHAVAMGNEPEVEQSEFEKLKTFINSYRPIDPKMQEFLQQYASSTLDVMTQLGDLINQDAPPPKPQTPAPIKRENPINVKKFGLYRFPFLQQEKLYLGDVENYPTVGQDYNFDGTHHKIWKTINRLPFLVNGYVDDEYSAVNRVLAAQAAKLLGLQCEEVFFGYFHGKAVTLTAFHEAVTLMENQALELYRLSSNYNYLADQKRAFYFLIQHWTAYINIGSETKERFDSHFIDSNGEVFLSNHQQAMWLTPQMMSKNLMVRLTINKLNYQSLKDMVRRVGSKDLADIVFSSIPDEFVELHDEIANQLNKSSFEKKKECFDANYNRLLEALQEYEMQITGGTI
jgi:hypothetical protein